MGYVRVVRWWSSNLGQLPLQNLGSVAYCYVFILYPPRPHFPPSNVLPEGVAPSCLDTPSTGVRHVSTQDHMPESPVSVPEYLCFWPLPYPSISVLPPSDPPLLFPRLPDPRCRRTLAASKISSTLTFSSLSAAACLYHGTRSFPPPLYPVFLVQTSKIGRRSTHSITFACLLSK